MAGLNCASVSTLASNILKNGLSGSISITDELCEEAMRLLAYPISDDSLIISGESGASGLGGLIGLSRSINYKALKEKFNFRLLVDDAHGFGTMGATGAGAGEEQNAQGGIDIYFSTFAKSMASIGAFIAGDFNIIDHLKYNIRSQIFAKTLPMPVVIGNLKRIELLRSNPGLKDQLWVIVNAIQNGLKEKGFNIGTTQSAVTPVLLNGTTYEALNLVRDLRNEYSIFCSVIAYPVVPKGVIMLRIIPTAVHTLQDVAQTILAFEKVKIKLDAGFYANQGEKAAILAKKEGL